MKKSPKTIRGVAKAEGPAADVAENDKWTMFLKQKRQHILDFAEKCEKVTFWTNFGVEIAALFAFGDRKSKKCEFSKPMLQLIVSYHIWATGFQTSPTH